MFYYLKLFRADVALISFFSYIIGSVLADNLKVRDIFIAALLTVISTNFIYSFNSWADRDIDRINKPWRPVPAGKIKPEAALSYSIVLLVLSCVYPFFIFTSCLTLFLFLLLPLLGILYSAKIFYLRKYPLPAILIISTGLVTPMSLGYFMNGSDPSLFFHFFIVLFLYCLSIVPLKDIEDIDGDVKSEVGNLFAKFGNHLLTFSVTGLILDCVMVFFFHFSEILKIYLFIFIISTAGLIVFYSRFKRNLKKLYQTVIYLVIIECITLLSLWLYNSINVCHNIMLISTLSAHILLFIIFLQVLSILIRSKKIIYYIIFVIAVLIGFSMELKNEFGSLTVLFYPSSYILTFPCTKIPVTILISYGSFGVLMRYLTDKLTEPIYLKAGFLSYLLSFIIILCIITFSLGFLIEWIGTYLKCWLYYEHILKDCYFSFPIKFGPLVWLVSMVIVNIISQLLYFIYQFFTSKV